MHTLQGMTCTLWIHPFVNKSLLSMPNILLHPLLARMFLQGTWCMI